VIGIDYHPLTPRPEAEIQAVTVYVKIDLPATTIVGSRNDASFGAADDCAAA
jgi:hypothetical protein